LEVAPGLLEALGLAPDGLAAGPDGLADAVLDRGGMPRLATASVATRRNN
jgi:hypothetical protein